MQRRDHRSATAGSIVRLLLVFAFAATGCSEHDRLRLRASFGNPAAQMALAERFESGTGIEPDPVRALGWYLAAADQGVAEAQLRLARRIEAGRGAPADPDEAMKWYHAAAQHGSAEGAYELGLRLEAGELAPRDLRSAAQWFERAAEGHGRAALALARMLDAGEGVDRDSEAALGWVRAAAEAGEAEAQLAIGIGQELGIDGKPDPAGAAVWYRRAAEQGNGDARLRLASLHVQGLGVARDPGEAARWLRPLAEAGNPAAQLALGDLHAEGQLAVKIEDLDSYLQYREAGTRGRSGARTLLDGLREKSDPDAEAARWYRASADQGNSAAQTRLAAALIRGEGVERNLVEAYQWLTLSDAPDAVTWRSQLEEVLRPEQLERARGQAQTWKAARGALVENPPVAAEP